MLPVHRCLWRSPGQYTRQFSSTSTTCSKIGKSPVVIPDTVTLTKFPPPKSKNPRETPIGSLQVKGPLGELSLGLPPFLTITETPIPSSTSRRATITIEDAKVRQQREMWGTSRANLQKLVLGVTEGHSSILRLVGVGYRAMIEDGGRLLQMRLGYSHTIEMPVPEGVKCSVPAPTRILLEGVDKTKVNQFAAKIRSWRIPEPYKGKGIFIGEETIKIKVKKIK
ncbi:mitochondrial 54S ribosomal protein YmL16 [Choiromyces venosus 120613-1]|uniref:Large ribosomal subunit protein uL6m n=1 Tax=Choiromyces venosus 120613-1 TaxID=1336337 RepID=A0A3N4JLA4_9PEZI|nr:mitochondrial 54S ribosomal protein YmL16 [Choiromyces venosus 120613-1]